MISMTVEQVITIAAKLELQDSVLVRSVAMMENKLSTLYAEQVICEVSHHLAMLITPSRPLFHDVDRVPDPGMLLLSRQLRSSPDHQTNHLLVRVAMASSLACLEEVASNLLLRYRPKTDPVRDLQYRFSA
jgi:hypothetical protein